MAVIVWLSASQRSIRIAQRAIVPPTVYRMKIPMIVREVEKTDGWTFSSRSAK